LIVVDTNVIAHFALNGTLKEKTFKLLKTDGEWAVPILWKSEFRNVLALYLRKKNLTLTEALEIIEFVENKLRLVEYNVNSTQVLELVNISICSAYDCEFVALAKQLNVRMVMGDKQILKEFPKNTLALQKV